MSDSKTVIAKSVLSSEELAKQMLSLSQRVQAIRNIAQVRGHFVFDTKLLTEPSEELEIRIESRLSGVRHLVKEQRLQVEADYVFAGTEAGAGSEEKESRRSFDLSATFIVLYEMMSDISSVPDEVVTAFASINVPFNLTSYTREFVHSCFGRVGLPSFEIPPFNAVAAIDALRNRDKAAEAEKAV